LSEDPARTVELCRLEDLADRSARGVEVPGLPSKVVVVRTGESIFGYLDACPHYSPGTPMAWKTDRYLNGDRTHIMCASHGALFDIATGACIIGPCLGQSLTRVPVRITSTGMIEATIAATAWETA
jgi:nitrite reductase/ring-hydroxylating ferredoxin subunit